MADNILTHRGIDVPLAVNSEISSGECTWEALSNQIDSGFGIEFDIYPTYGKRGFAVCHDSSLNRLSNGQLNLRIGDIHREKISSINITGGRLCELEELLNYISERQSGISALHLKHHCQSKELLQLLVDYIKPHIDRLEKHLIIFDVIPSTSFFLKNKLPQLSLAASVSHPFDIERYGAITGSTLLMSEEVLRHRDYYAWVWLDEWDRIGPDGKEKTFVCKDIIDEFCAEGILVAAVSPELHATTSALQGGEKHEDGICPERLQRRWASWEHMDISAICTDHATWFRNRFRQPS
jgi:hypothetical protein